MTAPFTPAGAAEFPNDNPSLHLGARWLCPSGRGPARAFWRASSHTVAPERAASASADAGLSLAPSPSPGAPPPLRHCNGPLQLDLGRIVLLHRVENVPPPPDFIYEPFVSSRAAPTPPAASARPIHPRPCRVVDARQARQRVQRGWRVDVAPCLDIGSIERRPSRHRAAVVPGHLHRGSPLDTPPALQAASA